MYMHWIDWAVIGTVAVFFVALAYSTKKYTQSSSDFLAANRLAGRYLLTLAEGVAGLGAVSIIARFQMVYKAGFAPNWWEQLQAPLLLMVMLTGWVIYRFRETRALTLAQFFEMRYGRRFRIYAASICWISGIINFGIFPAVGANFFMYYTGMPAHYSFLGLMLPTYHTLLIVLLSLSLYFTFSGGQIAVLVTDFFQSFFVNIVLVTILIVVLVKFPLSEIFEGLKIAPAGQSLLNPFDAQDVKGFDPWYFLIGLFALVINTRAWQGSQAYNVSAKSPHEAKMAGVLGQFRGFSLLWALTLLPLVAYMIMHHPNYTDWATQVNAALAGIADEQIRDQMITPMTMTLYMPIGLMGAFAAVMFAAFISTHDTYLHSWGAIFVQDVAMPIRQDVTESPRCARGEYLRWALPVGLLAAAISGACLYAGTDLLLQALLQFALGLVLVPVAIRRLHDLGLSGWFYILGFLPYISLALGLGLMLFRGTGGANRFGADPLAAPGAAAPAAGRAADLEPKTHLRLLRLAIFGVAVFIFLFSSFYRQTQDILLFFALTGAFWLGGAGVVIVGGLYTKWGTARGAFAALTAGSILATTGMVLEHYCQDWFGFDFPFTGQEVYFFAMVVAWILYASLSLAEKKQFNLDKMLHRGEYVVAADHTATGGRDLERRINWKSALGITEDFTRGDKFIYGFTIVKSLSFFTLWVIMTLVAVTVGIGTEGWATYHYYVNAMFFIGLTFVVMIWLSIGGLRDVFQLYKDLREAKRDFSDDGTVRDHDFALPSEEDD